MIRNLDHPTDTSDSAAGGHGGSRPTWLERLMEGGDHDDDQRTYAAVLDALSRELLDTELTDIEAHSTARRSMADIKEEQAETARDTIGEARDHVRAFREALHDARSRAAGTNVATYDSSDPTEDARADLLVQYLVRPGYAEVQTEERPGGGYAYHFSVDWARLQSLAESQGHHLTF